MKELLMRFFSRILWPLIEGSSRIVFDKENGEVRKIQQPRVFIRLLNFLAFQEWTTLYEREVGFQIAKCRREITHWVLQCGGVKCRVASCLGIESQEDKLVLVTERIRGRQPDRQEIISVSRDLTSLFLRAGLPTWSVCSFHPRFETNFIIDAEGIPVIIDLESHVLSIFVPIEELWNNLLIGNFPPFDDIHFPKLWLFFRQETGILPATERERFKVCIEKCERLTREQKEEEIRVWSRMIGLLLRLFGHRKEWL